MWHSSYGGRSIGRVLHFIECLQGFDMSERAEIGGGTVNYHGKVVATYDFVDTPESNDVPKFQFIDQYKVEFYDWREKIAILAGRVGQAKCELNRLENEQRGHQTTLNIYRSLIPLPFPSEVQEVVDTEEAEVQRLQPLIDETKARLDYAKDHEYDYIKLECSPPTKEYQITP
jgi:hypothetical protein